MAIYFEEQTSSKFESPFDGIKIYRVGSVEKVEGALVSQAVHQGVAVGSTAAEVLAELVRLLTEEVSIIRKPPRRESSAALKTTPVTKQQQQQNQAKHTHTMGICTHQQRVRD